MEECLPLAIKKWLGYNSLKLNNVNIHSTEKDPRSTKSPLNNWSTVKDQNVSSASH